VSIHHLRSECYEGPLRATLGDGCSALTHVGAIRLPNAPDAIRAVLKVYPRDILGATRELLNEFVGHFLAEAFEFPAPALAGTITIERKHWRGMDLWARTPPRTRSVVAWWTQQMPAKSVKARFQLDSITERHPLFKVQLAKIATELLRAPAAPGIVAFDEMLANVDRNLGNLLGPEGERYLLIDHGKCLTGDAWKRSDLIASGSFRNKLRELLEEHGLSLAFKSAAVAAFDRFQPPLSATMITLRDELRGVIDDTDADALVAFLRERARRDTAPRRLGLVI
jgi:hypothetical protein